MARKMNTPNQPTPASTPTPRSGRSINAEFERLDQQGTAFTTSLPGRRMRMKAGSPTFVGKTGAKKSSGVIASRKSTYRARPDVMPVVRSKKPKAGRQ